MSTMKSLGTSLVVVGILGGTAALAAPPFRNCPAYKAWSSGVISAETIGHENSPFPVEEASARRSAQTRCDNAWRARGGTTLSYTNSGGRVTVETKDGGKTYQYQCLICDDMVGTLPADWKQGAATMAFQRVEEVIEGRGEVVGVEPVFYSMGEMTGVNYEVIVVTDEHIARVFVDSNTGEVVLPESLVDVVVIPENVCQ